MPKNVVTIGGFSHEGLSANVKALGFELCTLSLDNVQPKTWLKRANFIKEFSENGNLAATIIYLHTTLLLTASKDEYRSAFFEILNQAVKSKQLYLCFKII